MLEDTETVELSESVESSQGDEESGVITPETSDSDIDDNNEDSKESDGETSEEEMTVTIGEESPSEESQEAPHWVKDVRKQNRELKKQNRDLQEKINRVNSVERKSVESKSVPVGKKPLLEDFDYDAERFEKSLSGWFKSQHEAEEQERKQRVQRDEEEKQWQERLNSYDSHKSKLKFSDFDDVEDIARDKLSKTQQGMIVQGADNPALVVYALGKNHKTLDKLSGIKDPVKFSFEVAKMETKLKVSSKKRPDTSPERTVKRLSGSTGVSGTVDSHLDSLREAAEKTGDYSKVMAYRRQKKK